MARIELDAEAAAAMVREAERYGRANNRSALEMGVALMVAGASLVSNRVNSVQFREMVEAIKVLTEPLRKPNAN